jgi:hypothetical protein
MNNLAKMNQTKMNHSAMNAAITNVYSLHSSEATTLYGSQESVSTSCKSDDAQNFPYHTINSSRTINSQGSKLSNIANSYVRSSISSDPGDFETSINSSNDLLPACYDINGRREMFINYGAINSTLGNNNDQSDFVLSLHRDAATRENRNSADLIANSRIHDNEIERNGVGRTSSGSWFRKYFPRHNSKKKNVPVQVNGIDIPVCRLSNENGIGLGLSEYHSGLELSDGIGLGLTDYCTGLQLSDYRSGLGSVELQKNWVNDYDNRSGLAQLQGGSLSDNGECGVAYSRSKAVIGDNANDLDCDKGQSTSVGDEHSSQEIIMCGTGEKVDLEHGVENIGVVDDGTREDKSLSLTIAHIGDTTVTDV